MTPRVAETIDSVSFVALDESEGRHRVNASALSTFAVKP